MELQQLANLGELLGGIGVIVSLLYLAYQVRGNSRAQRAENYARALALLSAVQARLAQDARLNEVMNKGLTQPERLTLNERTQFSWLLTEMFGAFEFMYLQYEEGNLPRIIWDQWLTTIRWWLTFEGLQRWWRARPSPFSTPFAELIEQHLREPIEMSNAAEWSNWLATGFCEGAPETNA